jgi:hypothetical protein
MQKLHELLAKLIEAEVEFVLVGGLAAAIHGSSLTTRDVDVCCRFTAANLMRLQRALEGLHPVHRMRPDLPVALTPEGCADLRNLYIKTDFGILDCLGFVLGVGDYDAVLAHSTIIELPTGKMRIVDIDTLIRAKEAMGRPHDLITIQHLQAVKRSKANEL